MNQNVIGINLPLDVNQKMDSVTVFPSVLLECTLKFPAVGLSCGLHTNTGQIKSMIIYGTQP